MRTRQWECGRVVIESSIRPRDRVVAHLASRRETRLDMVHWRERIVVVLLVARHASRSREVVVVVDVAIETLARWHGMRPRQGKPSCRMIELRSIPT